MSLLTCNCWAQHLAALQLETLAALPSREADWQVTIWVDEIGTPSIEFGPTHTHEGADGDGIAAIVDRARAILADQMLVIQDIGGLCPGSAAWLDLREPDALLEVLTSRYSPGRALLKSWSGKEDRIVSTETLPG